MKVLMLGWEYPPHISGGLGTACEGLTRALARHGVEVDFVLPRVYGAEDAGHMRLLDASEAPAFEAAQPTPWVSGSSRPPAGRRAPPRL